MLIFLRQQQAIDIAEGTRMQQTTSPSDTVVVRTSAPNAGIGYAMQLMLYSVIIAALLLVIAVVTTIVG